MKKIAYVLPVLLVQWALCFAQPYTTKNDKAIKLYEEAKNKYLLTEYDESLKLCGQALRKDSGFVEAFYLVAGTYKAKGMPSEDINTLQACARINGQTYPMAYNLLANEQFEYGRYADAYENVKVALSVKQLLTPLDQADCENIKARLEYCLKSIEHPVPYNPMNLGAEINGQYDDYLPALTADEEMLVWTTRLPIVGTRQAYQNQDQEDFFVSTKDNGKWTPRRPVGPPLNTPGNEGAQTITADGRLFFFTACTRPDGLGSCDIYYSQKRGDKWNLPRNLKSPVNSKYWESQPSCSADGRTVYFTSNRPGGLGQMDIYTSEMNDHGEWSAPKNLGPTINTKGDDMSPCIHPDGKTLYFASSGHFGMGGLDLFVSRKDSLGNWSEPKNLGYPINTWHDESDLRVNARGDFALISSDREGGYGKNDLYTFKLNPDVMPEPVTYVKGTIYDAKTKKKLQAVFELLDIATGTVVVQSFSDDITGQFLVPLPPNKEYALNAAREGYLFYSDNFNLKIAGSSERIFNLDIPLSPIEPGQKVVLQNVFFDSDSYILKEESKVELGKLYEFLAKNASLKIELGGHTDNTGDKAKNLVLSEQRAKSVMQYLVSKGIDQKRLTCKGYGDTKPIVENNSEANKAMNRRTEFMIVEK